MRPSASRRAGEGHQKCWRGGDGRRRLLAVRLLHASPDTSVPLQLERAGLVEAGMGGEGLRAAEDPQLLMHIMEAREAIDEAEVAAE